MKDKKCSNDNLNTSDIPDIPIGLGMALAQDLDAMARFAAMPEPMKAAVIERAANVHSKAEMQQLVEETAARDRAEYRG